MKAIIYTRVSKNSQSVQRQVSELKELEGFDVKRTFSESISGYTKSSFERNELQKAIKYAKRNSIEVILVHEISRLGRRTTEVLNLIEDFKNNGIKIYVKSLGLLINDNGIAETLNKFLVTIMTDLARMESERISFRVKSGIEQRKRNGLTVGRRIGSIEKRDVFLEKHKKVIGYLESGESIRWIAAKLRISPTTVQKVSNVLKEL